MKRKILAAVGVLAGLVGLFSLAGCGGSKDDKGGSSGSSAAEVESAPLFDFKTLDHTILQRREDAPPTVIFPPELTAEDNKPISIIGFMAPFEEMDNMKRFMLLPSYVGCFFCSPPSFTQVVLVEQHSTSDAKLPFINDPIIVTGTLRLYSKESKHPAHLAEFIYALDNATVTVYTGANAPKRAAGHQQARPLLGSKQPPPPVQGAAGHKAFQPQFLVSAVSDLRRLPMLEAVKFTPVPMDELTQRVSDYLTALHPAEEWHARERACVALGFSDKAFDLPHAMAALQVLRLPGFYDPAGHVVYYDKDLQFSQPDSRLHMVKLITEALLAQNAGAPATPPQGDDAVLAAEALRLGDIQRTATIYDQRTRLQAASPQPPAPGADVPMMLDTFSELYHRKAGDFVTQAFPPDQLEKLNSAYTQPPRSTAEVMHPEYYLIASSWKPEPVQWTDETLHGAKPLLSGVLGEAALTAWTGRFAHDEPTPAGWRGDRFAVWDGGAAGDSWVMETHWTDAAGAGQFFTATQKLAELLLHARIADEDKSGDAYTAHSEARTFRAVLRKDRNCVYVYCAKKDTEAGEIESKFVKP